MRFLNSGFLHEPTIHVLKYCQFIFVFAEIFRKLGFFHSDFREIIPGNHPISRKFDNFQLQGNNTRKLIKRQKWWVNFRVTIPRHFQLLGIVQFPGIVTRKQLPKNTIFVNTSAKTKIFVKIFSRVLIQGLGTIDLKNQI